MLEKFTNIYAGMFGRGLIDEFWIRGVHPENARRCGDWPGLAHRSDENIRSVLGRSCACRWKEQSERPSCGTRSGLGRDDAPYRSIQ